MADKTETTQSAKADTVSGITGMACLSDMVDELVGKYTRIWWDICKTPVNMTDDTAAPAEKRKRQTLTDNFIDAFFKKIERFPGINSGSEVWQAEVNTLKDNYIAQIGFIHKDEMDFLFSTDIIDATRKFADDAKQFDPNVKMEDVGQAIRNTWIMNIIQILLNRPIACTPSVFAYSMLYPYTDNYIDDEQISAESKKSYSKRFACRLKGEPVKPENEYEDKIFSLIGFIEKQYDRNIFPNVYESLLSIHRGQSKSLLQHKAGITPYNSDILSISFDKGGTSVLADAFLVKGDLSAAEMDFFFLYGLMLQLCDDLQDVRQDTENGHHTIFTLTAKAWPLDSITDALFNLLDYTVYLMDKLNTAYNPIPSLPLLKTIIRHNCSLLIYFAIAKNTAYYTKDYISKIKPYLPYNIGYINSLGKKLHRKYKKLKPSYNGVRTEDIMLCSLGYKL